LEKSDKKAIGRSSIEEGICTFPAASNPTIKIRISRLPNILSQILEKCNPIVVTDVNRRREGRARGGAGAEGRVKSDVSPHNERSSKGVAHNYWSRLSRS
jgi:hypothetical protein